MKKILVPCDFSKTAINAICTAFDFGKIEQAEVHLLHVIELPVVHDSVLMPILSFEASLLDELRLKADRTFKKIVSQFPQGSTTIVRAVLFGSVSRTIQTYIREQSIDLVIMGTKGSEGAREILIGSNTEKIVRTSKVPVLAVRQPVVFENIRTIVFPTNADFNSMEDVMRKLKSVQHVLKAKIELVWINTPANFANDVSALKRLNEVANRYMLKDYKVNVFNDGREETGIIRFAHKVKADMLVMATHGKRGLAHALSGSLTEDVVNHIDLPVWTFSVSSKEAVTLW
jgi:nucleotide-binding universal stress UspA family protein